LALPMRCIYQSDQFLVVERVPGERKMRIKMTNKQIDNLARSLIYLWGSAVRGGVTRYSPLADHCEEWARTIGRKWDHDAATRVETRLAILNDSFSRQYERHAGN